MPKTGASSATVWIRRSRSPNSPKPDCCSRTVGAALVPVAAVATVQVRGADDSCIRSGGKAVEDDAEMPFESLVAAVVEAPGLLHQ